MKNYYKAKILLPLCFLCIGTGFFCFAQTAEQTRAQNWFKLQQLLKLQAEAPYYLTASDLQQIATLQQAQTVCQSTSAVCQAVALPVTGLQLKGQRTNNEKVQLQWETKAEYNNKGFVLERQSIYNAALYDSLVFVTGAGTSYTKSEYNFTDLNNFTGNSFYRVRQVDFDGHFTYSNIVLVEGYASKFEVSVAPNPSFNNNVRFYFKGLDLNQTVSLSIFNATGVQIIRKDNFLPANGYYEIADQQLSQGYYFITVSSNGENYTKPFSVIR
jgi:hypothetical protein